MDMHVAQLPGLSIAAHMARERERNNNSHKRDDKNMPDSKGWRKIGNKQPKKHTKPKELTPLKIANDVPATTEDADDRRRQPSWPKTILNSRPATPVSAKPTTPANNDAEDTRSERSETSGPRRDSKPKRARYTSLLNNFKEKETPKGPEFSEPWSEDVLLPPFQSYTDPLEVLQAIRSHMTNSTKPIPVEHNSGLFRIFEDYRKVREQKEHLDTIAQEMLQDCDKAKDQWESSESRYQAEFRRLELLIASGTSGMTGLMKARQGSLVDRTRRHRKTVSNDNHPLMYEFMSHEQVDDEIKTRSQRVLLLHPASPSGKMIALSKHFANRPLELPVGNPPEAKREMTLTRKAQSELDLVSLTKMGATQFIASSAASGCSDSTGDPLSDEIMASNPVNMEPTVECDAFIALRELGALVARRRGLKVESFNDGLMKLFSNTRGADDPFESIQEEEEEDTQITAFNRNSESGKPGQIQTSEPPLRRFQSQPQLDVKHKHCRQFSFEPGADQLLAFKEELGTPKAQAQNSDSEDSDTPLLLQDHHLASGSQSVMSASPQILNADFDKPSKIPSPVQTLGRVRPRRENSASSIHSKTNDNRRDSQSSIQTAFRSNSSRNLRPLQSRNSSIQNLRAADSSLPSKDHSSGLRLRNNAMALAAARAAGNGSQTSLSEGGGSSRNSSRPPVSRAVHKEGLGKVENDNPPKGH